MEYQKADETGLFEVIHRTLLNKKSCPVSEAAYKLCVTESIHNIVV